MSVIATVVFSYSSENEISATGLVFDALPRKGERVIAPDGIRGVKAISLWEVRWVEHCPSYPSQPAPVTMVHVSIPGLR